MPPQLVTAYLQQGGADSPQPTRGLGAVGANEGFKLDKTIGVGQLGHDGGSGRGSM